MLYEWLKIEEIKRNKIKLISIKFLGDNMVYY